MIGYRFFIVIFFLLASFPGNSQLTYNPDIPWNKKEFKEFYKLVNVQSIGISESAFIEKYINNQSSLRDFMWDYSILPERFHLNYKVDKINELSSDCISNITLIDTNFIKPIYRKNQFEISDLNIIPQRLDYIEFVITKLFQSNEVTGNDFKEKIKSYNLKELIGRLKVIECSVRATITEKMVISYTANQEIYLELDNKSRVLRSFNYDNLSTIPLSEWDYKNLKILQNYCNNGSGFFNDKKLNPKAGIISICEESFDSVFSFLSFLTYKLR